MELKEVIRGERVDFGFYNLQHASAWAGSCIIILTGCALKQLSKKNYTISILLLLISSIFWFIFIGTQTRQTFLGLFSAIVFAFFFYAKNLNWSKRNIAIVASIAFISISVAFNSSGVKQRTIGEIETYSQLFSGNYNKFSDADDGSSVRLALWYAGYQWFKDYPILGSDREIGEHIVQTSPYAPVISKNAKHKHLHNYYVELAVSYGIVGLTVILSLFICIFLNLFKARHANGFDEVQFVGLVFIPYWLIVNIFEPHLLTSPGQLIHNVMIGSFFIFSKLHSKDNS
ncbi:O-antigen ligase family protein [Vibrio atypicus]|uniref:O-antigen ligase family protein n=1 Tax=Vibrio atypicus TaxID=558271 RepID=UPI00373623D4